MGNGGHLRAFKGFGWNNVGTVSQTLSDYYISIEPMYRVIWEVAFLVLGGESVTRIAMRQYPCEQGTITQCYFNVGPASKAFVPQ